MVSVAQEALVVVSALRRQKSLTFRALVADAESTLIVVARFLALLELYKDGQVRFEQVLALGELQVTWTGSETGAVLVSDEFDREPPREEDSLAEGGSIGATDPEKGGNE
jgi:segregation and condensation protein A